jgi:hypothetical protein
VKREQRIGNTLPSQLKRARSSGGLRVQAKQCATCIYRPDSALDLAELERQIADPRMPGHFRGSRICHHSKDAVCAGFWQRHRDHYDAGQIAQRLGLVELVDDDRLAPLGLRPTRPGYRACCGTKRSFPHAEGCAQKGRRSGHGASPVEDE